jgi:serine/threonine protein kinase/formylglycine-generating enzyme required for sulfatase activity
MPVALETFLSQLSSSGIVPEDKLKVVLSKKGSFADGEALARDMIKSRLLTKFQAEQILGGRGKNLTMGKYQILEKIGAGGMGQVYKAFHSGTQRIVAIKVILGKGKIEPEVVKRFEREVKAAAKLVHSNIITVFDADQADGRIFMVMEYIKGDDLGELLRKKGQLSFSEVVDYILQAAKGLKYAHDQGVIHRDIKPGNILVDSRGNVKIVDMGLAKLESKGDEGSISMLTASASVMGTVDFMSPEQGFSSKNVDARTDIYSLGATLFFILTRKVMFQGDNAFEKLLAHREAPIPSISNSRVGISPDLEIIFNKMVAKKVEDRYSSMAEVISAFLKLEMGNAENIVGFEDLATTHFERGSYPETMDIETLNTNVGKDLNKETDKQVGGYTVSYHSGFSLKTFSSLAIAVTGIIVLVLLFLIFSMDPGSNVKEEVKAQLAELVKLKQEAEAIVKRGEMAKAKLEEEMKAKQEDEAKAKKEQEMKAKEEEKLILKQEEEAKAKQMELGKLKQEEEAKAKQIDLVKMELLKLKLEEEAKAKQLELLKLKQEEEIKAKFVAIEKEMVLIPDGTFKMGSPVSEKGRHPSELQHEVTISKAFYMGKFEVTQEQWQSLMGNNPSQVKGAKLPVTNVSWEECQEFIKELNEKTKGGYRLPTEAEWEYACRAGTMKAYSFGNNIIKSDANIAGSSTKVVGSYKPNAFGIYDMHGNVCEWCEDWIGVYSVGAVTNPKGPGTGTYRVLRGGDFSDLALPVRSSYRSYQSPNIRFGNVGFRLARTK